MGKNKIKAIIFDLGNVLVDFDYTIAARRISSFTDKSLKDIFNLFFDSEITGIFEEGKISPSDFFLKVKEILGLRLDYEGFLPIWNEIFFLNPGNKAVYELTRKLKDNYRVALLSNINVLHFEYLKKNFPVFSAFHNIFTSFQMGLRKPQPRIYESVLDVLGVPADNVFYTDDRKELVESASCLGIRGSVFRGSERLKEDLAVNGIRLN